jgi:FkbM family methyltransferase
MTLKTLARDFLAKQHQVPAKYWYGKVRGSLEPEMRLLRYLVRPGQRVIDVGGNRGVYAYALWRLGCVVEVFEPNPVCCGVLSAWAQHRQGVQIHPVALSRSHGQAILHIPRDSSGVEHDASASIEHGTEGVSRDEVIQTRTLDSYAFATPSLIKIDVEGHEQGVLEGAASTLATAKPALLIEIEQRHNKGPLEAIFQSIRRLGYSGFFLDAGALRPLEHFDASTDQSMAQFGQVHARYINNFLFLHADRLVAAEYRELKRILP